MIKFVKKKERAIPLIPMFITMTVIYMKMR